MTGAQINQKQFLIYCYEIHRIFMNPDLNLDFFNSNPRFSDIVVQKFHLGLSKEQSKVYYEEVYLL